jgi:4-hydroxy-tetrahydrodipicolinate synthase
VTKPQAAELKGVVGALLTPFDQNGAVEIDALTPQYDFLASHCDAVSVLGAGVSEYLVLAPVERRTLLRSAVEALKGRVTVMAGVSAPTVAEAKELLELAASAGADVAQLLMPYRPWGGEPTDAEVVKFVELVAVDSPLPIAIYHHPGIGADPSLGAIVDACAVDGVIALKDSSRNIARNLQAVELIQKAGHANYLATIQPMLAVLLAGGAGAMMPPPMTLAGAALRDAVRDNDLRRAGEVEALIATYPTKWSKYGLLPVAKRGMNILGIQLGEPVHPYPGVPESETAAIAAALESWKPFLATNATVGAQK